MQTITGTLLLAVGAMCASCTVTSTGGYLRGKGNSSVFEGIHALTAETLSPSLNSNNCLLMEAGQIRKYTLSGRLEETYSVEVSKKMSHEYLIANYCK